MPRRRVAIVIASGSQHNNRVVQGALSFLRVEKECMTPLVWPDRANVAILGELRPDGILTCATDVERLPALESIRVPLVLVSSQHREDDRLPRADADDRLIGRSAGEHFIDRGFRHIGFYGVRGRPYVEPRRAALAEFLGEHGIKTLHFWQHDDISDTIEADAGGAPSPLNRWLVGLPKPVAILVCGDFDASRVAETCREAKLSVPEEVAILGIDNIEVICEAADPPLSSIPTPAWQMGRAAGKMLWRLMAGQRLEDRLVLVPPLPIVTRQSTSIFAVADPEVRRALIFIHEHPRTPISVDRVVEATVISRGILERRFRAAMGRTIRTHIERGRIASACGLLLETDWTVARVGRACGYASVSRFCKAFRRQREMTPKQYRLRFRRWHAPNP